MAPLSLTHQGRIILGREVFSQSNELNGHISIPVFSICPIIYMGPDRLCDFTDFGVLRQTYSALFTIFPHTTRSLGPALP